MNVESLRTPLDVEELETRHVGPGKLWRAVDVVPETGSTNVDLLARSEAGGDVAGAVLVADYQHAGRGRHGRRWSAPRCAQLSLSVGVDVAASPRDSWGWLPLVAGLAVVDAVRAAGVYAGLKWPNDVLVDGRKLAGILAEVTTGGTVVVVGIGLNVTLTPDDLPDPNATSLHMLGSGLVDRTQLLDELLTAFARRIEQWRDGGRHALLFSDYVDRSVTVGQRVRALLPGDREITGSATGIDDLGRLLIDAEDGSIAVSAGDITHLRH